MDLNEITLRVRFHEADPYGVTHHSRYFQWFDSGMLNFFEKILDLGVEKMQEAGISVPIIEDQCSYSKPCRFGEDVIVRTSMECDAKPIFSMHHVFINEESGEILARGKSRHIFATPDGRLIPRIPKIFKEHLEKSKQDHPEFFK